MTVEKMSISLPDELARQVDQLAERDAVSRSFIIREATTQYLAERASADAILRRRTAVDSALAGFDLIADAWGDDARAGIDYLDEVRGETPPAMAPREDTGDE